MMKRNYLIASVAVVIAIIAVAFVYSSGIKQERLLLALSWAGLEPLPASVQSLEVKPEGSAFSRTFRITFTLPSNDLEAWLENSEKLKNLSPELMTNGEEQYVLEPELGARVAELRVDMGSGRVELFVSLS